MRFYRPTLPSGVVCVLTAIYLLFVTNAPFWTQASAYFSDHKVKLIIFAFILLLLYVAIIIIFSVKYFIKPFLIFLVLVAAIGSYFTNTFGIIIDRHVIESVFATTQAESSHLITPHMIEHILLYGVLPSLVIIWIRFSHFRFFKKFGVNAAGVILCFIVACSLLYADLGSFASMYREERSTMMKKLEPVVPILSTVQYITHSVHDASGVLQPIGLDAKTPIIRNTTAKKRLTVIVVGETGRAQSFSLGGYHRETNPELKKRDVLYFPNTTSCGTETSVSVPCMFSMFTRQNYTGYKGRNTENLMDVLSHAGIKTIWWENNTGSKGVADRIGEQDFQNSNDPIYCTSSGECRDQILVDELKKKISSIDKDTVLVLHTLGSHGPSYYLRYPKDLVGFEPACKTSDFSDCTNDEIVNAYDNSILYTDQVLSEIIDLLKAQSDRLETSMIYMSDHGESLGEHGIYLHAMPYIIAPEQQKHIPFVAWFSPDFVKDNKLDLNCIRAKREKSYSHDNLFHTVLGMMDVSTSVYDETLDAFAACRAN